MVEAILIGAILATAVAWSLALALVPSGRKIPGALALPPLVVYTSLAGYAALVVGRGISDRQNYLRDLEEVARGGGIDSIEREPLFWAFLKGVSLFGATDVHLYAGVALVCAVVYIAALRLLMPWASVPVTFLGVLALGFFVTYSSVAIRQGLALACIVLAISLILTGARKSALVSLIVASLFHWSAITAAAVVLVVLVSKISYATLVKIWLVASAAAFTGVFRFLLSPLNQSIDRLGAYADPDLARSYSGGTLRVEFWLFSLGMLVAIHFFAVRAPGERGATDLARYFVALNCMYLLLAHVYFSDRIAVYSWTLAPIALIPALIKGGRTLGDHLRVFSTLIAILAVGFLFGPFGEILS
ncbi:EpsG family protein [Oceanitalea stevensii]|uniref:EpsG family protein n=1 Tax=Oceanitalea stevensii TaxID=2763072 RepID=A0ABR8Z4Y0_9MICO|nr:EpsG family protein [Oceanitalea stevensii]MBD8063398.1 EpsG family protein [Oceanitalea stevensii]